MNIGKENEIIEFKKTTAEIKEGLQSISAILNKHQKGYLYFGVRDNGDVIGQDIGKETLRDISKAIRSRLKPECEFEVNKKSSDDGRTFIEVYFSGNRVPYSADGKYFIRFSDEDKQMTNQELDKYFQDLKKDYSSWEKDDSNVSLNDVDEKVLRNEVNRGFSNKRIPFEYSDSIDVLKKFGLISASKDTLNNAGNVLFSKNKPILLKLATFATDTKDTFLKLEHFEGNIYECIEQALTYILSSIEWKIILDGSAQRKEYPEIPQKALREIIVNAFCHAKYDSNTAFEINVFRDRVTIYSPGFFPNGYTPEDFAIKHEEPIMLNPKIINVLFKTCEIESFGYGFDNAFKECKLAKVKYEYENTKSGFRFTFYRPLGQKYVQDQMTKTETKVLLAIKKNNYARISEIAKAIEKSDKTVSRAIKKLKELKYIERVGDDYNGYWKVLEK